MTTARPKWMPVLSLLTALSVLLSNVAWAAPSPTPSADASQRVDLGFPWPGSPTLPAEPAPSHLSAERTDLSTDSAAAAASTNAAAPLVARGRILFAPAIDLDNNPASNPSGDRLAPVIDLVGHVGGILMLAAQLAPDDPAQIPVGVPVTFRLWRDDVLLAEQTATSDAWAAASVEIPVADVSGQFSYQASAAGYGETELRRFRFDPGQKSHLLRADGAELSVQQDGNRLRFEMVSSVALQADRDQVTLLIMRRRAADSAGSTPETLDPTDETFGLREIPLPDVAMQITGNDRAVAEVQLPAGDYAFAASVLINATTVQQLYSQPQRIEIDQVAYRPTGAALWLSPIDYDAGLKLVEHAAPAGQRVFDLVASEDLPVLSETLTDQSQLVKLRRTGPFEWEEIVYDVRVQTVVDDGKKVAVLEGFDYDPIARRYTVAIKSLHQEVITDTLTIDVFGPGDIVIKQERTQVVLHPGQVLRYTVEAPAELGKPTGIRLTLDDPLIEDFRAVEAAIRNLYSTVSVQGEFNSFLRLYADIFGVELIRYTFRYPPGSSEFSFELLEELMSDPWELLLRLGGGALSGSSINIFGTIWNLFRGERDLDKLLDQLFRIDVGGLGADLGVELGYSATADFGKCPEDADIQDLKNRLQEIARRLDRLVADQVDFSSPALYKIPLHAIVAVQLRIRLRLGGSVSANDLTIRATGQGSIGASGRVAITPGFSFGFGAYVIVSAQIGKFINGLLVWVDVIKIVDEIINMRIPDGDCDPDPPDPRPPDERQDVWQGIERFYEGQTFDETIDNLSTLIQRAQEQGLGRAERLLTVRLRDAELGRFMANRAQAVAYADTTLSIMEATDIDLQGILSGTVPIAPSLTITEAMAARTTAGYEQIYAQPYLHEQQALLDAIDVAVRFYAELQGQELELQRELRQLLTGDAIGVLASGFAEATLSALSFIDLPATLISPWPAIDEFRGRPAPYFAPDLAPRTVVVPSGALHAIANSPGARDWLEAFVAGGGRLIVFTQAFGSDWTALPGGQVAGVGYEEDQRWQHATVEAGMPSDWLVWMGIARPDVQIDGAFTAWPANANILLRRTFGSFAGSPVLIEYPYGAGSVLATTAYGDWAWQTNFWWGDDARMTHSILMRGYLLARGQDVADAFAGDPASSVTVSFPLRNTGVFTVTSVDVVLPVRLGYWGQDYRAQVPVQLAPGATGQIVATLPTPPVMRGVHSWTQVGLYHLKVTAKGANGQQATVPGPFVYVRSPVLPPALAGRLTAASATVNLFQTVPVSATVQNYSTVARTVVISPQQDLPLDPVTLTVPAQGTATHVYTITADGSKAPAVAFYDEANRLISRATRAIRVALPDLRARPLVPPALSDGASLPVVVTNRAAQGQALNASLALSLTVPSGSMLWSDSLALPALAAGQTITPTFTVTGSANELGAYRLGYRVDDGRGLARTSFVPLASRLTMDGRLDRPTYRIRESGLVTVSLANSGQFDLIPTLTVSSTILGLAGAQVLDLPVGAGESIAYPFTLPDSLPAGSYRIELIYDVAGQAETKSLVVVVPPAQVAPALDVTSYAAGDTIAVSLANRGGVDAPFTAELTLEDRFGQSVATATATGTALAGGQAVVTLAIPSGAVSGDYVVRLVGSDTASGQAFGLRREAAIAGVSGDLFVRTDRPSYFGDEAITALATLTASGAPIVDGSVDLKICTPVLATDPELPPSGSLLDAVRQSLPPAGGSDLVSPVDQRKQQAEKDAEAAARQPEQADLVTFTPITGDPLQINVANDASYQVIYNSPVGTPGQVYWTNGNTADAGIFLWYDGYVIGPDFYNHPDYSASNYYDPWETVAQGPVTGSGTTGDPWVVQTDLVHSPSGVSLTTRNSYVDGDNFFRLDWDICLPQPASISTFLAADYYLQGSDYGYGLYDALSGSVGGYNQTLDWFQIFTPIRPATHYYEAWYYQIWDAIGSAGAAGPGFNDTITIDLVDNGAGLQWDLFVNGCTTVSAFWSFGETPTIPPVEPPYQDTCGYVLWEKTVPVSTDTSLSLSELAGTLDARGRLLLWGRANSSTSQPFAASQYPFYIHDRDTALTLETDRSIYRPGDLVQITGVVSNTSDLTQTMTLVVEANSTPLLQQPLTLAAGESYAYAASTLATLPLTLAASASNALVEVTPLVADPEVAAELLAPDVAGRDPFSVTLVVTNTGIVPAVVQTSLVGQPGPELSLQPGEVAAAQATVQIMADTELTATVDGDTALALSRMVYQGQQAALSLGSPDAELAGLISVPYTIAGAGSLLASGRLHLDVDGAPAAVAEFAVPAGGVNAGALAAEIGPGRHTLVGRLVDPFGNLMAEDSVELTLLAPALPADPQARLVDFTVAPSPVVAGGELTLQVTVRNDGATGPVVVSAQLFDAEQQWIVFPASFATESYTFTLPVPEDLPLDQYFGQLTIDGQSAPFTVDVVGIDVALALALDQVSYLPNQAGELQVTLTDLSGATNDFIVMSRYLGAEGYVTVTLPANQSIVTTLPFTATASSRATVFLSNAPTPAQGQRVLMLDSLPVQVSQPRQGAYLTFDKLVYDPGDTVYLTVHLTGTMASAIVMGPMELAYRSDGFLLWQAPLDDRGLVTPGAHELTFELPAALREGRYTFSLRIDGQSYTYPIDVNGWKVTTRHITLDKARYAQNDSIAATVEFWNEGDAPIEGLRLTAWVFTPNDGPVLELTPLVNDTVDLQPGLNVVRVSGRFATPSVGAHRLLVNVGLPATSWRVAGAVAQFDVGWAHLVELTTDKGAYAPGEPGSGRLDVYGYGPTRVLVTASTGSTLLDQQVDLAGHASFSFAIPTASEGDYLLVAQSTDRNGGVSQLQRAYAVPAPADLQAPVLIITSPISNTVFTSAAAATTVTVTGRATDDSGRVSVVINGQVITPTLAGDFSVPVELVQGLNLISAVAQDGAGNITFSDIVRVTVAPERRFRLSASPGVVGVGQPLAYTYLLTATGAISNVTVTDLLPTAFMTNPLATANTGEVVVSDRSITWTGDVLADQPVVVVVEATPTVTGIVTNTATVLWGYGLAEESNVVTVDVSTAVVCNLYPIALRDSTLAGLTPGAVVADILNGSGPGNVGWLTWAGSTSATALATSLTPPGNSDTYRNPDDPDDRVLSLGDWVRGVPGVNNSAAVRRALDALLGMPIVVPVWSEAANQGSNVRYRVAGYAEVAITGYSLPAGRISAIYRGMVSCAQ